ncbi:MAG: hypothetical protein DRI23_02690, partial [Candidatus Cloacimonadota bacterium]
MTKTTKTVEFFVILIIMLAVSMTLFIPIQNSIKLMIRIVFIVIFLILWVLLNKKNLTAAQDIAFALLILNIAFLIVSFFPSSFWNLQMESS